MLAQAVRSNFSSQKSTSLLTFLPFFMRKSQADIEEERRLFYVSSTRAIKQLVVSVGSEKRSIFLGPIKNSLYSTVYSVEEMMMQLSGGVGNSRERLKNLLGQATGVERERYLEHPIFGRGKVIETLSATKYMVLFVKKGKEPKVIDTSIVPVTFL